MVAVRLDRFWLVKSALVLQSVFDGLRELKARTFLIETFPFTLVELLAELRLAGIEGELIDAVE